MIFSIVVPTFNRRDLLRQTLDSVWPQRFSDYELIVVDDGSTDGTAEYLASLGSRIRHLRQPNKGPGAARNLGAVHAKGDYIAFLDSDDLWFPWTLEVVANSIRRYDKPAVISARLIEFSECRELSCASGEFSAAVFPDYFAASREGYFVGAGMAILRRTEFLKTEGFVSDRVNAEDHELMMRLGTAAGFVQILSPVTLAWRRHKGSLTASIASTLKGGEFLIQRENNNTFPGGKERALDRRRILTQHIRSMTVNYVKMGFQAEAWKLYFATFFWHLQLCRWKYLLGFPLCALLKRA